MPDTNVQTVQNYFAALAQGDLDAAGALIADDVVWHQPGGNNLSGDKVGKGELFPMLGAMAEFSGGTFAIDQVDEVMANGDLVAARIHFKGDHGGVSMAMNGVDLLRVEDGLIQEVWLFSGDQESEDRFWDHTAGLARG